MSNHITQNFHDSDPLETKEWLEALESVLKNEGRESAVERAKQL